MMYKILLLTIIVTTFSLAVAADDYRVEPLCSLGKDGQKIEKGKECFESDSRVDFIFPPDSNLKVDDGTLKRKYRYHFVKITGLSPDYRKSLRAVNNAKYYYSKDELGEETGSFTPCNSLPFCAILSSEAGAVVIRLDYDQLVKQLDKAPAEFNNLSIRLLRTLYILGKTAWAKSIPQNIVEKVFELVPTPADSSLARYVALNDKDKSFVLLNPKILLSVDTVERDEKPPTWSFRLLGTVTIRINRANDGSIIQSPFFREESTKPNNIIKSNDKLVLQASTADIQLSQTLSSSSYIFFHQLSFKRNNKNSNTGACTTEDDENRVICNSQLWHFSDLNSFYASDLNDLDRDEADYISSFGLRSLINPLIEIALNGNIIQIPLGTSLYQLRNQSPFPSSMRIHRMWMDDHCRIKGRDLDNLILLPGDAITF